MLIISRLRRIKQYLIVTISILFVLQTLQSQNVREDLLATYKGEAIGLENALSMYVKFNSISGNEKEAGTKSF